LAACAAAVHDVDVDICHSRVTWLNGAKFSVIRTFRTVEVVITDGAVWENCANGAVWKTEV